MVDFAESLNFHSGAAVWKGRQPTPFPLLVLSEKYISIETYFKIINDVNQSEFSPLNHNLNYFPKTSTV